MKCASNQLSKLLAVGSTSLLLASCASADPESGEVIDTTKQAVTFQPPGNTLGAPQYGFQWQTGWPEASMTPRASSVCFLSYVGGTFASDSDRVEIFSQDGILTLSGSETGGSKRAGAFCVTGSPFDVDTGIYWQVGQPAKNLGSATNRTCFLTTVWGNLNGNGKEVRTRIENGNWLLDGTAGGGRARCIQTSNFSAIDVVPGQNVGFLNTNQSSPTGPKMCALTRVSGMFRGGSMLVSIHNRNDLTFPWNWWITASRNSSSWSAHPSGSGRCIQ